MLFHQLPQVALHRISATVIYTIARQLIVLACQSSKYLELVNCRSDIVILDAILGRCQRRGTEDQPKFRKLRTGLFIIYGERIRRYALSRLPIALAANGRRSARVISCRNIAAACGVAHKLLSNALPWNQIIPRSSDPR